MISTGSYIQQTHGCYFTAAQLYTYVYVYLYNRDDEDGSDNDHPHVHLRGHPLPVIVVVVPVHHVWEGNKGHDDSTTTVSVSIPLQARKAMDGGLGID